MQQRKSEPNTTTKKSHYVSFRRVNLIFLPRFIELSGIQDVTGWDTCNFFAISRVILTPYPPEN